MLYRNYYTIFVRITAISDMENQSSGLGPHFSIRVGNGYDVHALEVGLPLNICGIGIDSNFGCVAHSDGDVAIHALCDALLGSLALGDIGHYFPDTDEKWAGIDSKILLAKVMEIRNTPELRFEYDESIEYAQNIENIISKLHE